ncbi:hypothetical protein [Polaribacter gangjinensis]|uniref:Uncharacterized protein n=1 Tax=Polaribacter gangjinensis TaxID=574710 RepID=A0A2S7W938_9FLAO|nr:hypothetical protein [Polaribacter gangjinensis]PQJ74154.1 hypothetical protein BTO13_02190 [Polaribacter gangjinensis]
MKEQNKIGCLPAVFWFLGGVFLMTGIAGIQWIGQDGFDGIGSFFMIPLGGFLIYLGIKKHQDFKRKIEKEEKYKKEEKEKSIIRREEINIQKNNEIKIKLIKADNLKIKLSEIQDIKIIDVSDYKNIIIDNEKSILDKGGDNQLFSFMKIDTFLRDYRGRIISDQSGLNEVLDIEWLKSRIQLEGQRNDLDKIIENLDDMSAKLEGGRTKGFDSNVDKLFELGDVMKPALENQIKTMEYYRNMAVAMIVFYLNDKKIRYFEIYEAFEKLGVFDSTWQKNVLNKLDNIEIRLAQISNQLTELNQNFISLVESSENVISELKEINSSIMTNNMLQAINAYQTWRINKNTKSLRN